jgi:hypothetical protein
MLHLMHIMLGGGLKDNLIARMLSFSIFSLVMENFLHCASCLYANLILTLIRFGDGLAICKFAMNFMIKFSTVHSFSFIIPDLLFGFKMHLDKSSTF